MSNYNRITTFPLARPVCRYSKASTALPSPSKYRSTTGFTRPASTSRATRAKPSASGWTGEEKTLTASGRHSPLNLERHFSSGPCSSVANDVSISLGAQSVERMWQ